MIAPELTDKEQVPSETKKKEKKDKKRKKKKKEKKEKKQLYDLKLVQEETKIGGKPGLAFDWWYIQPGEYVDWEANEIHADGGVWYGIDTRE